MASKDSENQSVNDSKELVGLCRAGRLFDVEKWIADGKSLEVHTARNHRKKTLLQTAVETGFHSMVEVVAKHDPSQDSKNAALADAVELHRLDLIEVLVANGAETSAISFADVLLTWEPKIIHFFISHGADLIKDKPFTVAFAERIRTALRPYLECKQKRPELAQALQEQLDCALRHFCAEGDLKWVSLLLWAGGDPRSLGPSYGKDYTTDPECFTTGLREACYSGKVDVLKKLKPTRDRDDLADLMSCAAFSLGKELIRYLLEQGAVANDKETGGSSALNSVLGRFNTFDVFRTGRLRSKYSLDKQFDCVKELLAHDAKWVPDRDHMNWLRKILLESDPEVTVELLQIFREYNACSAEQVHKLIDTSKMAEHLASQSGRLGRLGLTLKPQIPRARKRTGS